MDDELRKSIEQGSPLSKIPDDEIKRREEARRKRMEEIKKLSKSLEKSE